MKVGVRDIAREAGVAVSTVSHVLNGTASISREVRERVLDVARNLGYLDQRRAKATIATIERVVVAVTHDIVAIRDTDPRHRAMYDGIKRECDRRSLKVSLAVSPADTIDMALTRQVFETENASGVVVIGTGEIIDLGELALAEVPLVVVNGEEKLRRADAVVPANGFAAGIGVRHLEEKGHRRILLMTANGIPCLDRRRAGFANALAVSEMEAGEEITAEADGTAAGEAAMRHRLATTDGLDGATAIYCLSDQLALGAMKALVAAGLRVPGDVSVIGCDGTFRTSSTLTTASVFYERLGISALAVMESRLMVPKAYRSCIHVELGADLIKGNTVGPPPGKGDMRKTPVRLRERRLQSVIGRGGPHARPFSGRPR